MRMGKARMVSLARQFSQLLEQQHLIKTHSRSGQQMSITSMHRPGDGAARAVTLIPGDGLGPLVTGAVVQVMEAMNAPVCFETYEVSGKMAKVPEEVFESIGKNKVCLTGGLATPIWGGVSSLTQRLREQFDVCVSLVHCFNLPGLKAQHANVDIVIIQANPDGKNDSLEYEDAQEIRLDNDLNLLFRKLRAERTAKYAFEYAYLNNKKSVTAVHNAHVHTTKLTDELFLEQCREIAKRYPHIKYNEVIVSNCCEQLMSIPQQYDVIVTPTRYGTLVANTAASIAGGTGVMPGATVGPQHAIFEQGASYLRFLGDAHHEEFVQPTRANPVATLLSSAMMLRHLQLPIFANRLQRAVMGVVAEGTYLTKDIRGTSSTQVLETVDAVLEKLN